MVAGGAGEVQGYPAISLYGSWTSRARTRFLQSCCALCAFSSIESRYTNGNCKEDHRCEEGSTRYEKGSRSPQGRCDQKASCKRGAPESDQDGLQQDHASGSPR